MHVQWEKMLLHHYSIFWAEKQCAGAHELHILYKGVHCIKELQWLLFVSWIGKSLSCKKWAYRMKIRMAIVEFDWLF